MASKAQRLALQLTLTWLLTAAAIGGCGGSGGDSTASTASTEAHPSAAKTTPGASKEAKPGGGSTGSGTGSAEPGPPASAFVPRHHHDSGGGSAQFRVKGGDNSVQEFGAEAGESELQAAATALHGFLDARAARNWAAACAYLSVATKEGFAQLNATSQPRSCAATLATLSGKVPTATLREAAVADVGSLREEGGQAFLIYRGPPKGTVYAIPMAREDGAWKLASLAGTPLN